MNSFLNFITTNIKNLIFYYIIVINLISFIIMGIDKYKAVKRKYRTPEKKLIIFSFIGGCYGIITGMFIFNHKIKKRALNTLFYFSAILITILLIILDKIL